MIENKSLLIMAGGVSSRMKRSLDTAQISLATKNIALNVHKSLIPLGETGKPLLYYLLNNAKAAGYEKVYIITGAENEAFRIFLKTHTIAGLNILFAVQHLVEGYKKPLGTADALAQAMEQFPELKKNIFTICNGDNLYSVNALSILRKPRKVPHALISFDRSGLEFSNERISKFAVLAFDKQGQLETIIEKPKPEEVEQCRDSRGKIRVSMNCFSFTGDSIYSYVKNCPIHPQRHEKELPQAVRNFIKENPNQFLAIPVSEHLPDLTAANDLEEFQHFKG